MSKRVVECYPVSDFFSQEKIEEMWMWDWNFQPGVEVEGTLVNISSFVYSLQKFDNPVPESLLALSEREPDAIILM